MQLGINQSQLGKEMHAMAARRAAKKSGLRRRPFKAGGRQVAQRAIRQCRERGSTPYALTPAVCIIVDSIWQS